MRVRAFSAWAGLLLAFARPVSAEAQPPAIWYRASETCPDGAQFLEKLRESSRQARLAQAGDHIDFVVTLLANDRETVGRLERQTNSGSVAIRELRDATCERVADALALSLGLALAPGQSPSEPRGVAASVSGAPADVASSANVEASPPTSPPATPAPAPAVPATTVAQAAAPAASPEPAAAAGPRWSLGLEVGPMIGISTEPQLRGQAFVDLRPALTRVLPKLSLRAGVVAAGGSSDTEIGAVRRWILAGRAEACPIGWSVGRFELRPCLAFELGATGASAKGEAGVDDRGLWAAPGAQLRLTFSLQPKWLWLEASGGMLVPLTRNEIYSGSQSLYRDAPAVFHGGLGLSLRLP